MAERRIKCLDIYADFLLDIIKQSDGQFGVTVEGIPGDARAIGCAAQRNFASGNEVIRLFVESQEFPDLVFYAAHPPPLNVQFHLDREKREICRKCPHNKGRTKQQ